MFEQALLTQEPILVRLYLSYLAPSHLACHSVVLLSANDDLISSKTISVISKTNIDYHDSIIDSLSILAMVTSMSNCVQHISSMLKFYLTLYRDYELEVTKKVKLYKIV